VSKVAMKGVGKDMRKNLGDFQFGVTILHNVNRVLSERHFDGSLAMLTVDFFNAFNLVDKTILLREVRERCPSISLWFDFLYSQATRLYVGDGLFGRLSVCNKETLWSRFFFPLSCTHFFIGLETIASLFYMLGILMMVL